MSYNSNIGTLPEGRLRISGSAIEVTGRFAISGSRVEITGSMYGGDISGAVGQFSSLTASSLDVVNLSADTITAREYYTELVTASVIYESGSTKFGDDANDVHQFSGSIQQSGNVDNYFLGNVGLGTTNPTTKLYVSGSQTIRAEENNEDPLLDIQEYRGVTLAKFYEFGDAGVLKLGYYGMSSHNILLNGGTSAAGGSISAQHNGTTGFLIHSNTSSNSYVLGNVGLGTTTPSAPLHILKTGGETGSLNVGLIVDYEATGAELVGAGTAILFRGKSGGGNISNYDQAQISTHNYGTNNAHGISFYTKPNASTSLTEYMRISNAGYLGIGTTGPVARLHVQHNNAGITTILGRGQDANFILNTSQSLTNNSGDVLMEMGLRYGTSANKNAAIRFHRGGGSVGGFLSFTSNNDTERMRIDPTGNVGIGITNPSYELEVAGDVSGSTARFTDYIGNGSQITNLTASNIDNFTQDVRAQFTAGTDITIVNGVISSTAGGGGGSTPGGPDTSVQFNKSSTLSGSSNLTYDYTTNVLSGTVSQFTAVSSSYLVLSGNAEPVQTEGTIFYDNTNGLLRQWTEVTNVDLHLGQQLAVRIKNDSGTTLSKGKVVHITGSTNSDTPLVTTASYENDSVSADTLGVLMSELAADETGYALLYGVLTGIDLSTYDSGDMLYLSSSGDFSNSVPLSPLHEVRVGQVTRATNNGAMFVRIQNGYETDELHDVLFSSKAEGDLISWDNATGVWRNTKTLSGSYVVSGALTAAAGDNTFGLSTGVSLELGKANSNTAGAIKLWGTTTDSYSLIQSTTSNLHLDAPTGIYLNYYDGDFVQVGSEIRVSNGNQTDPQYTFVNDPDTGMFLGGTNELAFTTSGSEKLRIDDTGNVGIGTPTPGRKLTVAGGVELTTADTTINSANVTIRRGSGGQMELDAPGDVLVNIDTNNNQTNAKFAIRKDASVVAELFRVQENGYVGIGTNAPEHTLSVTGTLGVSGNTTLSTLTASNAEFTNITADTITAREYYTELVTASVIYESGSTKFGDDANDIHQFSGSIRQSGSTLANYFLGNLAVGDSNPASYKLYVNGTSKFDNSMIVDGSLTVDTNTLFVNSVNNRVGVGTTTPGATFHVNGNSILSGSVTSYFTYMSTGTPYAAVPGGASDSAAILRIAASNYNSWLKFDTPNVASNNSKSFIGAIYNSAYSQNLLFYSGKQGNNAFTNEESALNAVFSQTYVSFHTTGSGAGDTIERMRIDSVGNVGIGTDAPSSLLHLKSTGDVGLILQADSDNVDETHNPYIAMSQDGVTVAAGGVIGLVGNDNTEPANEQYFTGSLANHLLIGTKNSVAGIQLGSFNDVGITIKANSNNVGIGVNSPSAKLHVSGSDITMQKLETSGNGYKLLTLESAGGDAGINISKTGGTHWGIQATSAGLSFINRGTGDNLNDLSITILNSNSNVGIGINSPGELLDVRTSTATAGQGARLGEAKVGTWEGSNSYAAFTHQNVHGTANSYALLQSDLGETALNTASGRSLFLKNNNSTKMMIDSTGNVGIGTTSPGANFDVSGSTIFGRISSDTHEFSGSVNVSGTLTATAKSFDIPHPTKDGMRLRYGSLEGAENGVYVRGMTTGSVIELPEHWTGLVDEETITVNLTPYGTSQQLWVKKIEDNKVYIGGKLNKCFFTVFGERKDIDKLVVEY